MKPKSRSLILLLSALAVQTVAGDTYVVDGVNLSTITDSTRFYDNGKGYYWNWSALSSALETAYNANNKSYSFLGDWQSYTTGEGEVYSTTQISGLRQDANTCWYNVSANLITYWQTTYGVFYTGSDTLQTGYTYDKSYLSAFGGTQSLDVGKLMYDNWTNTGGYLEMATSWYFCGDTTWSNLNTDCAAAGYFKDYFGDSSQGSYYSTVDYTFFGSRAGSGNLASGTMTLEHVTTAFSDGFGFSDDGKADAGKIGYLGITSTVGGHAITCYGYNTDESGVIQSLIVTNSDDLVYGTFEVYLKIEDGDIWLYQDEELTKRWTYAGGEWYIDELSFIKTPQALQNMLAQYQDTNNSLVWNGEKSEWSSSFETQTNAEDMPTAETGWDVYAESDSHAGYFHAYYDTQRAVDFGDYAGASQTITVSGAVKSGTLNLSNSAYDYTFKASGSSDSITASNLYKNGSGTVEFQGLQVISQGYADISGGTLKLTDGTWLTAPKVEVKAHGTLALDSGNVSSLLGIVNVYDKGTLAIGAGGGKISSAALTLQDGAILSFTLGATNLDTAALTLTGTLTIDGLCSFLFNESELTNNSVYRLIYFSYGWEDAAAQLTNISLGTGSLSYSDNTLFYTYIQSTSLTWDTQDADTWSSALWDGETTDTNSANITFAKNADVTVSGSVTPGTITVNSGCSVSLLAGENADISGTRTVTLASNAALTTQLELAGRSISLAEGASLTYDITGSNTITDINMAAGSSLILQDQTTGGTNTQHVIKNADNLAGNISIGTGNDLTLELNESKTISGTVSADAGTQLNFGNSNAAEDITYTVSQGTSNIAGTINVGRDTDTRGTILSTGGTSAASFNLASKGTLQLTGGTADTPADFSGSVSGNGTLQIAANAYVNLAVNSNKPTFNQDTTLLVNGHAVLGAYCNGTYATTGITYTICNDIIVDAGQLNVWFDHYNAGSTGLTLQNLTLANGGSFTIEPTFSDYYFSSSTMQFNIASLNVGSGGGSLNISSGSRSYSSYYGFADSRFNIDTLSGSGDISFSNCGLYDNTTNIVSIAHADDYSGNITVQTETGYSANLNEFHLNAIEFTGATAMSGSVTLNGEEIYGYYMLSAGALNDTMGRAVMGIQADVEIGGLDGNERSYLYSGALDATATLTPSIITSDETVNLASDTYNVAVTDKTAEAATIASAITKAEHTLTINTGNSHNYAGTVLSGISLQKEGSGTQVFSGDVSRMNGDITVKEGKLSFSSGDDLNLRNLIVAAGATLHSEGNIIATGDVTFAAGGTIASIKRAASLSAADINLQGTATVDAHLDLSMADSLTMATTVEMAGHNLTLGKAPVELTLTLSVADLAPDTVFNLDLFTGVASLYLGETGYTSGEWAANLFFTSDYITADTTLVYANQIVSLYNLKTVPEPGTATLSLLALACLAGRRRRK